MSTFLPPDESLSFPAMVGAIHKIMLEGRCSINGGEDEVCSAVALSLTSLTIVSGATVSFADEAILALPRVGLLKAYVSLTFPGGFDLKFDPATHSKLARYVEYLDTRGQGTHEARDYERFVPLKKLVTIRRAGAADSMARIVDLSRSGVAFTSSKAFTVGEDLLIGPYPSKIVRVLEGGATAHFADIIAEAEFNPMFDLDAPRKNGRFAIVPANTSKGTSTRALDVPPTQTFGSSSPRGAASP